jgi:3-hydroxyisobutyrate dehydrogenase
MTEQVGFIGLGIMGQGMARNILKAEFPLIVWNRTTAKAEALAEAGAQVAGSPADVTAQSDVIVICVSDTPDVEAVMHGESGVLASLKAGSIVIDCSTISPLVTRQLAQLVAEKGAAMLDAPVSGGSEGAAQGTLSIMVGGEAEAFARALPVLNAMGKKITHVGASGAGQTVKLVNQILVVSTMLGLGEALLFAQAGGVDLKKTLDAISAGAAGSWTLSNRGPQVIRRDWSPGFMIDLQQKDVRLVLEAAATMGVPLPGTALVHQLYNTLQKQGFGRDGNHALVRALENLAGFEIEPVTET